ncbi:class I SAM-dependent methyltransferase [Brevundimonas sp. NPDC046655]|uniref:class I SAM-dependent methyltransferase n=1 Tax=unclassified Brevundimonas TaxID=2622653 RepID=UPI00384F4E84
MKDTDADWAMLGEGEPFYGVLSDPRFLRANITPAALEEFWQTGRNEMHGYRQLIQAHFGDFSDASALDFGCGVGRLTRAMGEMCRQATGLDISPGMLVEARRHAPANVNYVSALGDETFDWLNSIIVFQHIPPQRGYRLLDDLLARVNSGGALSLHVTLFKDESFLTHLWPTLHRGQWDGDRFVSFDHDQGDVGGMEMYDYDMSRIIEMTSRHGFHNLIIQHTNHGGCHGVIMFGRKGR